MTNIIKFPGVSELPLNQEEMIERLSTTREQYADEVAEECFEAVMAIAHSYGMLTNQNKNHVPDTVAIYEVMRAAFLRYSGLSHPFQDVIDQVITEVDETEMASLTGESSQEFDTPIEVQ